MNWLGCVWRSSGIIMYNTLNWIPESNNPLGRPKKRIEESKQKFQIIGENILEEYISDRAMEEVVWGSDSPNSP